MLPETGAFELNRRLESLVLSGCNGLSRFSVPLLPEPLFGSVVLFLPVPGFPLTNLVPVVSGFCCLRKRKKRP
jgi:hypothetical protein